VIVWTVPSLSLRARALALTAFGWAGLACAACGTGSPAPQDSESSPATTPASTSDTAGEGPVDPTEASSSGGPEALPEDPFTLDRSNVKLLPFRVRFNRLQQLAGLKADDPAFAVLLARRYELGDYDYANGVNPDLTWTASRISVWIAAILPVCRSPAMRARFPKFPADLPALLTAAYGIVPDADKLADYEVLLGDANIDETTRHDSVCVTALTALEFVAQ